MEHLIGSDGAAAVSALLFCLSRNIKFPAHSLNRHTIPPCVLYPKMPAGKIAPTLARQKKSRDISAPSCRQSELTRNPRPFLQKPMRKLAAGHFLSGPLTMN